MSTFTALNLEPEDNIEQEVDDSREIQIEEALKLYQNALKLHSQGPAFAEEAAAAYEALFKSEVFRYPEAASEFAKEPEPHGDEHVPFSPHDATHLLPTNAVDGSPNSLLQIIYLSYKNYGQFVLDSLKGQVASQADKDANTKDSTLPLLAEGATALKRFAQALERDDSDLDLWRKAARVGEILSSHRLIRFCLESVLVTDEENTYDVSDLFGLDELAAFEDLKRELQVVDDDLSMMQTPDLHVKKVLSGPLKRRMDPYPFLPAARTKIEYADDRRRPLHFTPQRKTIESPTRTWTGVGMAIFRTILEEQNEGSLGPGAAVNIDAPPREESVVEAEIEVELPVPEVKEEATKASPEHESPPVKADEMEVDDQNQDETRVEYESRGTPDNVEDQLNAQLTNGIAETLQNAEDSGAAVVEGQDITTEGPPISLPTRKRNSMTAGNEDPTESGRIKSKRLRARESNAEAILQEEEVAVDFPKFYEDQLIELSQADDNIFNTVEQMLDPLQIHEMAHYRQFRDLQSTESQESNTRPTDYSPIVTAMVDLQAAMGTWTDEKGQAISIGDGTTDLDGVGNSKTVGLALFQEHTKPTVPQAVITNTFVEDEGLDDFILKVNSSWTHPHSSALLWLESLILPRDGSETTKAAFEHESRSPYLRAQWPKPLKELVVNLIVTEDAYFTEVMQQRLLTLERRLLDSFSSGSMKLTAQELGHVEMAQTIFELHLDIYYAITNPSSEVDKHTRIKQKDRLHRWNDIASSFINHYSMQEGIDLRDGQAIRFLYAATLHAIKADDAIQDHIMLCLKDLQRLLEKTNDMTMFLPNNAAMPEISASAVAQEMSRLSTLDFFMAMFNSEETDAVTVIESLEPVLESSAGIVANINTENGNGMETDAENHVQPSLSAQAQELVEFLDRGSASLTLFLWRRLRDAYKSIDYPPKVVSCYLRMFQVVMKELTSSTYMEKDQEQRQFALLKWLKYLDDIMVKLMPMVLTTQNALECVDENHLKDAISAVSQLAFILHAFALYDDGIRIGQNQGPSLRSAAANRAFDKVKDKLREMQMRLWTLLYLLLRDGMSQNKELFPNEADDRANYLRFVHNAMGLRGYCKYSNKVFLKLMKQEFIALKSWQEHENDFAQVLFDLHGLKFGYGIGDFDHGCSPESLDKKTANHIIAFVMEQANRINIKDLLKSDLKATIEKMQQVMGSYKTNPILSFNKRVINQYLKSSINPADIYKCLKGVGDLPTRPGKVDSSAVAETGWYFLQGHIALARYKSVKRVNPTATDDLDSAATFFRQDLDHDIEKWETWYRLAQVYDMKIEDDLLWTAEKINNHRGELATLQRNAIHCYIMAVAISSRSAETTLEATENMSDMYTEFGIRLYASSRDPLTMLPFSLENHERFYSSEETGQMYKTKPFSEMKIYAVWSLAAHFLKKAILGKPKKWINYYYLSKCWWKMFCNTGDPRSIRSKPGVDELLEVLTEAVENLPERKDNRADPILEPHIKLVSLVHKLVSRRMIDPARGSEVLQVSKWARKAHLSEEEDGWEPYILQILKFLSQADKAHWHHRITSRAAHVIYDDNEKDLAAALGAKHEMTQQIFTKTMTLQVWKPENERPGRHFVYTTRYVNFFIGILYQLNDRTNLDMLARRIRRKPSDYLNHGKLWESVCNTYVALLRKIGKLPLGIEEATFKAMTTEEFAKRTAPVEAWAHNPETTSPTIDVLRDALELKKLNNSLMKGTAFDDLIADAFTKVYETYYRDHPEPEEEETETSGPPMTISNPATTTQTDASVPAQLDGTNESSSNPAPSGLPAGTDSSSTAQPSTGAQKPIRTKTVSRREVIRRSEAVVAKAAVTQAAAASKALAAGRYARLIERASSGPTVSASGEANGTAATTENNSPGPASPKSPTNHKDSAANDQVSAPGSPAQPNSREDGEDEPDADDEAAENAAEDNGSGSELSDLDEEEYNDLERKANQSFQGLLAARNRKNSTSSSNNNEIPESGQDSDRDDDGTAGGAEDEDGPEDGEDGGEDAEDAGEDAGDQTAMDEDEGTENAGAEDDQDEDQDETMAEAD